MLIFSSIGSMKSTNKVLTTTPFAVNIFVSTFPSSKIVPSIVTPAPLVLSLIVSVSIPPSAYNGPEKITGP